MFKIVRIKGSSMEPDYHEGDFVVVGLAKWFPVRERQIVVFYHRNMGLLIKKLSSFDDEGFYVTGTNSRSMSSQQIGLIPYKNMLGKVLLQFSRQ